MAEQQLRRAIQNPGTRPRIPHDIRVTILTLHWHARMSFKTIASRFPGIVTERGAANLVQKAKVGPVLTNHSRSLQLITRVI